MTSVAAKTRPDQLVRVCCPNCGEDVQVYGNPDDLRYAVHNATLLPGQRSSANCIMSDRPVKALS